MKKTNSMNIFFRLIIVIVLLVPLALASEPLFSQKSWHLLGSEPTIFRQNEIQHLPLGNSTASLVEFAYAPAILSNHESGGFAALEPLAISIHGNSSLWQRYWFNGNDITDPAQPGQPLIDIPFHAWDMIGFQSMLSSHNQMSGLNWITDRRHTLEKEKNNLILHSALAGTMGGSTWMPANTFDREPAQKWGAPEKRRHFLPSYEEDALLIIPSKKGISSVFYEGKYHDRTFMNLEGSEKSQRHTLLLDHQFDSDSKNQNIFSLAYQHTDRQHWSIENGNTPKNTLYGKRQAMFINFSQQEKHSHKHQFLHTAIGISNNDLNSQQLIQSRSLEDEELQHGRWPKPKQSLGLFLDVQGKKAQNLNDPGAWLRWLPGSEKKEPLWWYGASLRISMVDIREYYPFMTIQRSYLQSPLDATKFFGGKATEYSAHLRPEIGIRKGSKKIYTDYSGSILWQGMFDDQQLLIQSLQPALQIKNSYQLSRRSQLKAGIQHEPVLLDSSVSSFLNADRLSGYRHAWYDDNNDGVVQDNELGSILDRTGPAFHSKANSLKTPVMEEFFVGFSHDFPNAITSVVNVHFKMFRNLYEVRYDPSFEAEFEKIARDDSLTGYLYNRTDSLQGEELYQLTNNAKPSYYTAIELQFIKKQIPGSPFFANLSLHANLQLAAPPPGNGSQYNDIGRFDEATADPNGRIVNWAHTDYNRAYVFKGMFGYEFFPGFTLANILRYRDGAPLGEVIIAEGLSQGPTAIMDQERAQPLLGRPRYTYALTWDLRLRYQLQWMNANWALSFDTYNLFDSSTELSEWHLASEHYRDPYETNSPRSFRIMLSVFY